MQKRIKIGMVLTLSVALTIGLVYCLAWNKKEENTGIAFYYTANNVQVETDTVPAGYMLDTYTCSNASTEIRWNTELNTIKVITSGSSNCKVYLKPYIAINTIEDLVTLSNEVNSGTTHQGDTFLLMRDLDFESASSYTNANRTDYGDINGNNTVEPLITELTTGKGFTPIGNRTNPYFGNFDGGYHRIDNLHEYISIEGIDGGLFGRIGDSAVSNLTVSGEVEIDVTNTNGSGIVSAAINESSIINCHNEVNVTSNYGSYSMGGVAGAVVTGEHSLTISNCTNSGNITGASNTGGVIGYNGGTLSINNSYNTGAVTNALGNNIGGVLGADGNASCTTTLSNVYNDGDLTLGGTVSSLSTTGGIMGKVSGSMTLTNSHNNGKVINNRDTGEKLVAGLIGFVLGSANISHSYNIGMIRNAVTEWTSGDKYAAGLVGAINSETLTSKISNSYNAGHIYNGSRTGGLVGTTQSHLIIDRCYNLGTVESNINFNSGVMVGGLIGWTHAYSYTHGNIIVLNSYNMGDISMINNSGHTSTYISGLVGVNSLNNNELVILNSYNANSISGLKTYGITYNVSNASLKLNNVFNYGTTSGTSQNYGIGYIAGTYTIENAYYKSGVSESNASISATAMAAADFNTSSFVSTLNTNKNGITLTNYHADLSNYSLCGWKLGARGYIILDC